jgi:hypothetical protein
MAKYFKHPNGITVSEFQMLCILLNRQCDYKVALSVVRDELEAKKEKGRYWLVSHDRAWDYFKINFNFSLAKIKIDNMYDLLEAARLQFEVKEGRT